MPMSAWRSTVGPCGLPRVALPLLVLLGICHAHGEGCSGEACAASAPSLLALKAETNSANTLDMTEDANGTMEDISENVAASTTKDTSGVFLAASMEFIFKKLAQLETVVELQQGEIQELRACGCTQKNASATEAVKEDAKAPKANRAQKVLETVLRKHERQMEDRKFVTASKVSSKPQSPKLEEEIAQSGRAKETSLAEAHPDPFPSDSVAFAAIGSAEMAVDLLSRFNVGWSHGCGKDDPQLTVTKEEIKVKIGKLWCWLEIAGSRKTIFDWNFPEVKQPFPEPIKTLVTLGANLLSCKGDAGEVLACLGKTLIEKVPPLNFLTRIDSLVSEFIETFARIASSAVQTVAKQSHSLLQQAVTSDFPAVGAAPVLHHSDKNLVIRTHTRHAPRHAPGPKPQMSALQESGPDTDAPAKPTEKGVISFGFGQSDKSYRSKLVTQFGGVEMDTESCLAFAPKSKSGNNNQSTRLDWQRPTTGSPFLELEPWAVPCSPTFLRQNWDKWQGYSVYGWDLPVEKCAVVSFTFATQPVLAFGGGLEFDFLSKLFTLSISVCWPDFMPGGPQLGSITLEVRFFNQLIMSMTWRLVTRFGNSDPHFHFTAAPAGVAQGRPRNGLMYNARGLLPMNSLQAQQYNALLQNQSAAEQKRQTVSEDDAEWALDAADLYLASAEMGDDMQSTLLSEHRGEEVLERLKSTRGMSALQENASTASGANYRQLFRFKNSGLVGFDIQGVLEDSKLDFIMSLEFGEFGSHSKRFRLFDIAEQTGAILSAMPFIPASSRQKAIETLGNLTGGNVIRAVPPPVLRPGSSVALKNNFHSRYVRLNSGSVDSATNTQQNANDLTWERFTVIDAGNGQVALHNTAWNRFLRMSPTTVDASPVRSADELTADWTYERFRVVELANNEIALHSTAHNRFLSVGAGTVLRSESMAWNQLPTNWQWERLSVVQLKSLQPGDIVALHNAQVGRFLSMQPLPDMGYSSPAAATSLPSNWNHERFRVVDTGNGTIALHCATFNRFVKMWGDDMTASPMKDASALPSDWKSERFTVMYWPHTGGEDIALHNALSNRFVRMTANGVDTSVQMDLQQQPTDAQLRFKVLKLPSDLTAASDAAYSMELN
ncbi:unnamed protein product [Symbiodinium sp. CCMP2592]|nr:unnamed protein product [Symbiodinium sp. CCMP2592]